MRARGGMANGVFGCAVIGIVILASLGVAFLGNADERAVDTTDWSYVTSANPAFTYDQAPARVDYSPPANITGYTTNPNGSEYISGVTYTATPSPTAYLAKKEPILHGAGNISFNDLVTNGLTYIGNQPAEFTEAHFRVGGFTTQYSPAAATTLTNLSAALEAATSSTFDNKSIITLTPTTGNMFFTQANEDGGGAWIGAPIAHYYEYEISGVLCDRAEIDFKTQIAKLYDGTTLKYTISATNALLVVADVDNTITTTAQLKNLTTSYTVYSYDFEYINPNNGVSPIPTSPTLPPTLTSISYLNSNTTYNGFILTGADIIADGLGDLDFNYSIKVLAGSTCHVSNHAEVHGGVFYGTNEFNWTPTQAGTYVFALAEGSGNTYEITYQGVTYPVDYPVFLSVTVVDLGTLYWFNGYENASIDLMVKSFEGTIQAGGVQISCASSIWTVGGVAVGTWPAIIVTYDMDAGVYVTPVVSFTNFNAYATYENIVTVNTAAGSPRDSLTFYVPVDVTLSVVHTEVYLDGGGVYRVDSYLDVAAKFPNYTTYNVTINGAPHWGDYITINGQTCAVDKAAGTVEISGVTLPLAGLVLAYSDSTFYYKGNVYEAGHLVAINDGLAVDLGAAAGLVLQFNGTWYYETALYSGAPGTVTVIDWTPGVLGLDAPAFAAVFTLLALVGLVLASRLGGGTWDYLVLGSAVLVGFIMCGVFI